VIAMIGRYCDGVVPAAGEPGEAEARIRQVVEQAAADADAAIERLAIHEAIAAIWRIVEELNGYLTEQEPWSVAKDPARRGRLETVLATAAEGLRALAVLLSPVIPKATERLWAALGAEPVLGLLLDQPLREAGRWGQLPAGARTAALPPLFPRIEPEALSA
jgi:methionyl-tRNA synthetase